MPKAQTSRAPNPVANPSRFFEIDMEYAQRFDQARKAATVPANARELYFEALTTLADTAGPMFRYLSMIRFHDKRDEIAWYDPVTKFIHMPLWWMDKATFKGVSTKEDVSFVTLHEILHHFLAHPSLVREFGDLPHLLVNIGADIVINNMLLTLFEGSRYNHVVNLNVHRLLYFKREWGTMNEAQILALFRNYIPLFQTAENYVREKGASVIEQLENDHQQRFQEEIEHAIHSGVQQHQQDQQRQQMQQEIDEEAAQQGEQGEQGQPQVGPGQPAAGQGQGQGQSQGQGQAGQGQGQPDQGGAPSATSEAVSRRSQMEERAQQTPGMPQRLSDALQRRMEQQGQDFDDQPQRADAARDAAADYQAGKRQGDELDSALDDLTSGLEAGEGEGKGMQEVAREFQEGFEQAARDQGQGDLLRDFEDKFGKLNLGDYLVNRKMFGESPREAIGDVSKKLPKHFDAGKFLEDMVENHQRLKGTMSGDTFMKAMFRRTRTISLVAQLRTLLSPNGQSGRGMLDKRQDVHDGVIMPSLVTRSGKIAVLVDTSGSQSNDDVMDGLNAAFKSVMVGHEVTLVFNDAERYNHVRVRTAAQLKSFLKARGFVRWGGSVFVSVFNDFILKKRFDKVIFVTDLYIDAAPLPRGVAKDMVVLYTHSDSAVEGFLKNNPTWQGAKFFPISLKRTVTLS